jgi:hypothetical protein
MRALPLLFLALSLGCQKGPAPSASLSSTPNSQVPSSEAPSRSVADDRSPGGQSPEDRSAEGELPAASKPRLETTAELVRADARDLAQLSALAQGPSASPEQRLVALQRLESLDSQRSVSISLALARDPQVADPRLARLLQVNAVAALVRAEKQGHAKAHEALAELEQDQSLSQLITQLRAQPKQ